MSNLRENKRYKNLVMMDQAAFLPDPSIDFPEDDPSAQLVEIVHDVDDNIVFDDTYPYLDDSWEYKWNRFKCVAGYLTFAKLTNRIRYGLRVKNRSVMRRYRKELRNGGISLCNHVYKWDAVCVLDAVGKAKFFMPVLATHLMGPDKWFIRYFGGIPVPDTAKGTRAFYAAFDEIHRRKQWIHFFPEARSWKYYTPIRPFHKGAFVMAYRYGLPIIPCAISYRPRTGIYKWFDKPDVPLMTLTMGEPIFPDTNAPRKDEVERLRNLSHAAMVKAAGIKENTWPASAD